MLQSQKLLPLFADTGQAALMQKKIDIHGGTVILSIAIAPGFEDLPTLAYFRLKEGAALACVYLTNGEDIPNYECGSSAHETAKQRKEEAYTVMNSLHGEAYFLNIPARAFIPSDNSSFEIEKYFLNLDKIIVDVKPDIVLLNADYVFSNAISTRLLAIEKNVELALERLKTAHQWHEVKIFVQSDNAMRGERVHVDETNIITHQSYTEIADDIQKII